MSWELVHMKSGMSSLLVSKRRLVCAQGTALEGRTLFFFFFWNCSEAWLLSQLESPRRKGKFGLSATSQPAGCKTCGLPSDKLRDLER